MEVEPMEISIRKLTEGYKDSGEEGLVGFGGKLDIRPPYQRNFVYDDDKRNAVIRSVLKQHPLNTMYWNVKDDGSFEVLDGQQRTVSICEFVDNSFSVDDNIFRFSAKRCAEAILGLSTYGILV